MAELHQPVDEAQKVTRALLSSGQISQTAARKILKALGRPQTADHEIMIAESREDFFTLFALAVTGIFVSLGKGISNALVKTPHRSGQHQQSSTADTSAPDAGVGSNVSVLLSFDALTQSLKPLFNEYVWWFVAMLLVISGSIMGIREAWLRFEGIARPLTILFVFFAYHGLFLGLGIFIARQNHATGRMLVILSALLIPVMFSIANTVARESLEAGAIATGVSLFLSALTLGLIARRLELPYFAALCYMPIPFALAALAPLTGSLSWLTPLLISSIGASLVAAGGTITHAKGTQRFVLTLAGAIVLGITFQAIPIAVEDDLTRSLRIIFIMLVLAQVANVFRALDSGRTRFYSAFEIVIYAIISVMSVAGAGTTLAWGTNLLPVNFRLAIYPVALAIFLRSARYHNAAIHPLIFLAMLSALHVARIFTLESAWLNLAFFTVPLLLPWFAGQAHENKQRLYLYWACISGLVGSALAFDAGPHLAKALIGIITAITIHRAAGLSRSAFHYLSPIGLIAFVAQFPVFSDSRLQIHEIFFAVAVIYAFGGWIFEKRAPAATPDSAHPIDDLSLVSGFVALLTIGLEPARFSFSHFGGLATIWSFLSLRSLRDRSALVSFGANVGAVWVLYNLLRIQNYATAASYFIATAGAFYAITFLIKSSGKPNLNYGRVFLMRLRLPFDCRGRNNVAYAAGATVLLLMAFTFFSAVGWIMNPDFDARISLLFAEAGLLTLIALVFHFSNLDFLRVRGNVILLFLLLLGIAVAAITNRLGRPLPVEQVAFKLAVLFPVIAVLTAAVKVYGPRYGKYLEAERHGSWYYLVPVTATFALVALLGYEIVVVSLLEFDRAFAQVPPLFYLSLALYPLILTHTVRANFRHAFYAFVPVFIAAQWAQSIGGDYLLFRQNIVLGFSFGVLVLSLVAFATRRGRETQTVSRWAFSDNYLGVSTESGYWSLGFTAAIALLSFQVAAILPGLVLAAVSVIYLFSGNIRSSALILFTAGLLVVHGGAHLTAVYPVWPGPALAAAAILMIYPVRRIANRLDLSFAFVSETGIVAGGLYVLAAFIYAATEGRVANPLSAGMSVLAADFNFVATGGFYNSISLAATFLLTAFFLMLILRRIEGHARSAFALLSHFSIVGFISTLTWLILSRLNFSVTFFAAAPFLLVALLLFEIAITARLNASRESDEDFYAGNFTARDLVIILCGLIFLPLAQTPPAAIPFAPLVALGALLLYLILNIQAAFASQKTRYVYVAEATIAGIYFSIRPLLGISNPAADAFIALGYAFALVGVAIAAERLGWSVVSEPTRRFAALLPLVAMLITDNLRSVSAAIVSLISSGLYFSLSRLGERNLFAALAAIALNAAIFFASLSQGFDSSEFYALPIGLTIIFFATIFKGSLTPENQARVRMIGGLVAYVPAALQVTFRAGLAQNGTYSLVFGLFCLLGIGMGTLLRIRSYLFLGSLFLTLDIAANLVQEGLQNQFVGFMLLTLTGLGLIAALIIFNLKRAEILAALERSRARFATWR